MRLCLQIRDSQDGSVVWAGAEEMSYSHESLAEDTITFKGAVEQSARGQQAVVDVEAVHLQHGA